MCCTCNAIPGSYKCLATASGCMGHVPRRRSNDLENFGIPYLLYPARETTPLEARERYPNIMMTNTDGSSKLTNAFQKAIKAEADRVAAQVAAQNAQGFGGAPQPAPVNGV